MPKIIVEIEWDKPEDINWLNADNVGVALHAYCKNTKFKVKPHRPREKMSFIQPILVETVITDGVDTCGHEDETHIGIERFESGDEIRPYLAIETSKCKACGGTIEKHWLTAYKNYIEGHG